MLAGEEKERSPSGPGLSVRPSGRTRPGSVILLSTLSFSCRAAVDGVAPEINCSPQRSTPVAPPREAPFRPVQPDTLCPSASSPARCPATLHLAPCTLLFAAAPPPTTAISLRRRHRRARRTGSLGIIQATRSGAFTNHSAPLETAQSHPPWLPKTPSPPLASVAGVRPLRSTRPICILTTPPSPATGSQTPPAALTRASCLPSPAPPPSRCPDRPHPAPAAGPVPA